MLLAAGSAGLAVAVVGPRLRGRDRGLIYWGSITRFRNPEEYRAAIGKLDLGGVTNEITEHCFELSRIAERKYALLTWAIWAGILGLAIGSLYLL
jgi:hypothetical protein